jgi:PAS domain S-box-containing protein
MNVRQTTHILLIEDNPGDTQLVRIFMKDAAFKYELFVADTFFEGMDILNKHEIDIVLLDLSLPDTQGFKTLNRFMETVTNIPVIVMTGVNNEIVGNQAVKAGAQDFLVKGQFDGKLLGRAIRYAIQRHKEFQKLEDTKRELTINERRIVKAQQLAGFGNWEMDLVSNEMVWTDEIYRIFGFHPGSITTGLSTYNKLVHFEDKEAVESFFEDATKDGKLHKIEHRIIVDGTSLRWLAMHAQVFFDDMTQRTLLVGGIQDITERKMNEQLIMEQNINRQTAMLKEEAMQDMSFHIRTPLSSIVNLLYLMENSNVTPQQNELIEGLKVSVDDLSLMLSNMLNFSMLVSQNLKLEPEEFHIRDFFNSIGKVVQIKTDNAKVNFEFNLQEDLPEKIIADSKKITQIVYNLVDHAIRYTPTGGKITLDVMLVTGEKQAASMQLKATYSGKALNINQIKELMEENKILETIKNETTETDKQQLALAIVGKLVKILRGSFNISNKLNDTTAFEMELPIQAVKNFVFDASAPDAPLKILFVEDHFLNQMATKKLLTSWSPFVSVDIAENGSVAIEKFRSHSYDLILMDLQMPVMNGFDATVKIREKSKIPIIALTATATKQESDKCHEIGMNDYISKPFKPQELYAKIMSMIALGVEDAVVV